MSDVKDFTPGQRVTVLPDSEAFARGFAAGEVVKLGRKYVHVLFDGTQKPEAVTPDILAPVVEAPEPTVADAVAETVGALADSITTPGMRLTGRRAHRDNRRTARQMQRASRRANRKR